MPCDSFLQQLPYSTPIIIHVNIATASGDETVLKVNASETLSPDNGSIFIAGPNGISVTGGIIPINGLTSGSYVATIFATTSSEIILSPTSEVSFAVPIVPT